MTTPLSLTVNDFWDRYGYDGCKEDYYIRTVVLAHYGSDSRPLITLEVWRDMSDYSRNYRLILHDFPEIITDVYYDNDLMAIVAKMIDDYLRGYLDWGTPEADIEAAVVDSWAERLIKIHPALETIQL